MPWQALLVLALVFSGVAIPPAEAGEQVKIFHMIYVEKTENGLNYFVSNETLSVNFTELFQSSKELKDEFQVKLANNSLLARFGNNTIVVGNITDLGDWNQTIDELPGQVTLDNQTRSLVEENTSDHYYRLELSSFNTVINNETVSAEGIKYIYSNANYTTIITTIMEVNSDHYSRVVTFLYYTDPSVNDTSWFGDWVVMNFTHTLSEYYLLLSKALLFAVNNVYNGKKDYHSKQLVKAYSVLATHLYKLHNIVINQLPSLDKPAEQSITLAIDPIMDFINLILGKVGEYISGISVEWSWSGIIVKVHGYQFKISFWHEFSWWYPWYRLHVVFQSNTPGGLLKIDAGLSLLPFASTLTVEGEGLNWLFEKVTEWSIETITGWILSHVFAELALNQLGKTGAGAWAAILANIVTHSFLATAFNKLTHDPESWYVSAFAALTCAAIDIGEAGFHAISGLLKALGRFITGKIRHIMNSCWARGIPTAEIVNAINGFADILLAIFFIYLGEAGVVW